MPSDSPELERLSKLLRSSEQLLCIAPAVHRTSDGSRMRRVWLGVGKTKARGDHAVFIFTRTRLACAQRLREWIYCVLPVVANVLIDVQESCCVFSWSQKAKTARLRYQGVGADVSRPPGDCLIEDVIDKDGVLQALQEFHATACQRSLVFHGYIHGTSERMNHRELWQYRDAIPLDLAKLQPDQVRNDRMRGTKSPGMLGRGTNASQGQTRPETLRLLCATWNVGATLPIPEQTLTQLLSEESSADIVCLGFQEVCSLTMKRLVKDGEEWTEWKAWAEQGVEAAYNGELELLQERHLVGLLMLVFVRKRLKGQVADVRACVIPTGVGGVGGNKGAVCARFEIGTASLCFVNAHLAAGQEHYIERCQHFRTIIERILFRHADVDVEGDDDKQPEAERVESFSNNRKSLISGREAMATRSVTMMTGDRMLQTEVYTVHDHDHIFWLGDTNSRLHWPGQLGGMPIEQAVQKVRERRIGELLALDQLTLMIRDGMAFDGFEELKIHFLPSYKWRPGGDALDMRSQKHVPAWTDRILFRSQTRPPAEALRYDMHLGLKQSDHRPVFACFNVPWEGTTEKDGAGSCSSADLPRVRDRSPESKVAVRGSLRDGEEPSFTLQPSDASFTEAKPDRQRECIVRLSLNGGSGSANFKVFLRGEGGELETLSSVPPDPIHCRESPEDDVDLGRWLSVSPAEGRIDHRETKEVRISMCLNRAVLKRHTAEACLVFSFSSSPGNSPSRGDCRFPVRAAVEPSVMRIPLPTLAALGSRPIVPGPDDDPLCPASESAGVHLPPKEVMAVMQWVLMQSRDVAPGALHWWPDPLLDSARRGQEELHELQRLVEHNWPLPTNNPQLPPRSAAAFLLRWLNVLPEPVLPSSIFDQSDKASDLSALIRNIPTLPRCVLVCIVSLFAQLSQRHGGTGNDAAFSQRLASCFTQQAPASNSAEQMMNALLLEFRGDATWPPLHFLAASL